MKRLNWQIGLSVVLVLLSTALYFIHFFIFRDAHHIAIYLLGDIAFIPIEVLLVTLVIHQLLNTREKKAMLNKLNMVVGAFFSEAGTGLLKTFSLLDTEIAQIRQKLVVSNEWNHKDFLGVGAGLKTRKFTIDIERADLSGMRVFLLEKRAFLLGLLENPNLLEHESFTDLLWAVFHLTEELTDRDAFDNLPQKDCEHIAGDIKRAYGLLICEWIAYMEHLRAHYPYLFSLAMRTNPFDAAASVIIK